MKLKVAGYLANGENLKNYFLFYHLGNVVLIK